MNLPPFVYITAQSNLDGAGLVLSTVKPYYYARVWKFKNEMEMYSKIDELKPLCHVQVEGYKILLTFAGSLDGVITAQDRNYKTVLMDIFEKMAEFYYKEKILSSMGYYKRFQIPG